MVASSILFLGNKGANIMVPRVACVYCVLVSFQNEVGELGGLSVHACHIS